MVPIQKWAAFSHRMPIIMHGIKEYNLTEEIIRAHIDTEYQRTEK